MRTMTGLGLASLFFALLQAPIASAALEPAPQIGRATPKQVVDYHHQALRSLQLYLLPEKDIDTIEQNAKQTISTLKKVEAWEQMSAEQMESLSLSHKTVASTLAAAEADGLRLVCKRSAPTGSNRRQRRCETMASRALRAQDSRNMLEDLRLKGVNHAEQLMQGDNRGPGS